MNSKQQEIAENYLREKRRLNAQRIELFDQLADFRRKTEQLVAQVMYLTQDDIWDRQQIYRSVELNVAKVERAATHYARYLADSEHEAIVRYKQALDET
ncbi:hypothetical protein R7892_02570 [Ligilactobacillus murinus]|uniref:hypothetical protein n=1 Tax=Ligilactobacillus murinus TaxID=1622 RepID=UPI00296AA8B1|nr:hypothetical protein [Ligilactobacillus murinus]WOY89655.1 hypothetical protein R7892_02570 [Ligilactobacillus murinus]